MAGMNQHEQATTAHKTMNNGLAETYQKVAENHQKTMGNITVNDTRPLVSFVAMDEHERVVVVHEIMNNGRSGMYQVMTKTHRRMINAG